MKISLWSTAAAAAASILAFGVAAQSPSEPFQEIAVEGNVPVFTPRTVDSSPVQVMVLLAGEPVALVQKHAGRLLTRAEKDSVIAQRKAEQAVAQPQIESRGGKVVASLQSALNGLKVEIPQNQVNDLRSLPGVVDVKPVGTYEIDNTVSVPFVGAPAVWKGPPSNRGQSVKIAIVDTGIDYTHANFGGPGTVAAFNAAFAASTSPADPALFGDNAPKVKGGIDLVGDAYTGRNTPVPDSNPLDCNGHGSHTAGTAAGFGVAANGTTYSGNYDSSIYTPHAFKIGPGVAPAAKLYAVRVFGCSGSTNVVSEAIDWAVDNDMDVISMSLGADWGPADNSESIAIRNANDAGVLVIAASGNSGSKPYIASAPAASEGAIGVAAMDSTASFPGATLAVTGIATPLLVQNSNGAVFADGTSYPIVVLRNADGTVSLGCNESEYSDAVIAGKLVVTARGICARIARAQFGFAHGAAAVALINNAAGYPVFEGDIPALSGGGIVTIPFFGVLQADGPALSGPTGGPSPAGAVARNSVVANPGYRTTASFSSSGPRFGDSALRPNVTAPGVSVLSTAVGTGNGGVVESGTSMATPHVAGVAALVKKANTSWSVADQRAALVQSGNAATMLDYSPRSNGSGAIEAPSAVNTQAVVRTDGNAISFGYADLQADFHGSRSVSIHNYDKSSATFNVTVSQVKTAPGVTVTAPSTITVAGQGDASFNVGLNVPSASIGATHTGGGACCLFYEIGGYLKLTPASSKTNNGVALTVPYYFVPRSRSSLSSTASGPFGPTSPPATLTVSNAAGTPLAGRPDFYALGLSTSSAQGIPYADTRAVGAKVVGTGASRVVVFAINTFDRFSAATPSEWDIYIDTTGTGNPNYVLVGANGKFFTTAASAQNALVAALINLHTGAVTSLRFADVATDNSTILLPVTASAIGLSAANPRLRYWENHFSGTTGDGAAMPGSAKFNAFAPAISVSYLGGALSPGASAPATINVNSAEWASSPPLGLMVVAPDNGAGATQAQLLPATP